jgi:peptidoglycan/xylan/chitin deacetylase (PgdA/CDA1 family)
VLTKTAGAGLVLLGVLAAAGSLVARVQPPPSASRAIAMTFDDLPGVLARPTADELLDINRRLLATLRISGVPAIGFVNEGRLDVDGERDQRTAVLRSWVDAGMALGNHSYNHEGFNDATLADYEADVLRGERVTRPLLEAKGKPLVWYRHPFNQTGPTLDAKTRFEAFAHAHGYRIAPFTVEATDYLFTKVYERAIGDKKSSQADQVMSEYLQFQDRMLDWAQAFSVETFGREIPQVLLCHVNRINADAMPELLRRLRARGYAFITLDRAAQDPAYQTADDYVGRRGVSWLHRWRVAMKLPPRLDGEPDPPQWVLQP